jgi:hypothetical protein
MASDYLFGIFKIFLTATFFIEMIALSQDSKRYCIRVSGESIVSLFLRFSKPRDRRYNESEMTNCEASLLIDHPSYKAIFCYYRRGAR